MAVITVIIYSRSLRGAFRAQSVGGVRSGSREEARCPDCCPYRAASGGLTRPSGTRHVPGRLPLGGVAAEACGRAGPHLTGCSQAPGLQNGVLLFFNYAIIAVTHEFH